MSNSPWRTDKLAYNRNRKPDVAITDEQRELVRKRQEEEFQRDLKRMTREVWDE